MRTAISLICICILVACSEVSMPEADEGALFYTSNCTGCHGVSGRADGGLSADPGVAAPDLTQLARANGGTFPTARALSYIYGDPEGGHLARIMPQFGGALADDLVPLEVDGVLTPTPRALVALLAYLKDIQR